MGFWDGPDHMQTICASLHSRQITTPTPHHSIFTGQMLFLTPNQQCQSTEGSVLKVKGILELKWRCFLGASLVRNGGSEDVVQPELTSDGGSRQFTLLLPAFSDHDQRIIPPSSTNFHHQLPRPESSGLKVCRCTACGEQFSNYGLYALHRCVQCQQAAPVKCTACSRRFSRSSDLLRHSCQPPANDSYHVPDRQHSDVDRPKRTKSDQSPVYVCNQCHKQFRSNSHLTRHLQATLFLPNLTTTNSQ